MKKITRAGSVASVALAAAALAAGCGTTNAASQPRPVVTKTVIRTVPAATTTKPTESAPSSAPAAAPTQAAQPAQPAPAQPAPQFANATAVVSQFYQDITDHNYSAAWGLGGDNISNGVSYATWAAGYSDTTASIALGTVSDFGADQVQADLIATQLDGSVKTYQGTYTVQNGVIVAANIIQTS